MTRYSLVRFRAPTAAAGALMTSLGLGGTEQGAGWPITVWLGAEPVTCLASVYSYVPRARRRFGMGSVRPSRLTLDTYVRSQANAGAAGDPVTCPDTWPARALHRTSALAARHICCQDTARCRLRRARRRAACGLCCVCVARSLRRRVQRRPAGRGRATTLIGQAGSIARGARRARLHSAFLVAVLPGRPAGWRV